MVIVNGTKSNLTDISCEVPQGSILGPSLLCQRYVHWHNSDCKFLLYADDSTIMFSHKNPQSTSPKFGKELESCSEWLIDNKLSLHLSTTECILFGQKHTLLCTQSCFGNNKNLSTALYNGNETTKN